MWALRRATGAATRSKNALTVVTRAFSRNSAVIDSSLTANCSRGLYTEVSAELFPFGHSIVIFPRIRRFSSHPDERTSNSEADDEFSDLDSAPLSDNISVHEELTGGEDISEDESEVAKTKPVGGLSKLSNTETKSRSIKKLEGTNSKLFFQVVMDSPVQSLNAVLDKWIEDGNSFGRDETTQALFHLQKQRFYRKALQFVEWLERGKRLNLEEHDYAVHLDLIAKVRGIQKAEKYIERVPQSFKSEVIYEALLANCVSTGNVKKAEEIFKKIKDLSLPVTVSACNQMILLYKRVNRSKIANVLLMMEKENIEPSLFTYKLLIDSKGRSHDISGMEQVMEMMKANGVEPDIATLDMVARFYIDGGLTEKAEAAVKELEGEDIKDRRNAIRALLCLYAALGKADDVGRIWNLCEPKPTLQDFLAAIEAWGKLGRIKDAEDVFETMINEWKPSVKYYNALLNVYAEHKLLTKGKDLAKRMSDNGCRIGPLTWDVLVKLYVNAGEVEKADSILRKVTEQDQNRPLYKSHICVMKEFAERGDVHNTEKIFDRLKKMEYPGRSPPYQLLLEAYFKAKSPAYGFRERMRADNVVPNRQITAQLAALEASKERHISELLE